MARHKNRSGGGQESCCLTNREWRVKSKASIAKPHPSWPVTWQAATISRPTFKSTRQVYKIIAIVSAE